MISKLLKGMVIASVFAVGGYGGDGTIKSIEVHGGLINNKQVRKEVSEIAKAGDIHKIDIKKMQKKDCSLTFYPLDGSDFKHGARWQDKYTCEWHYSNVVPMSKTRTYGIYNGLWSRINKNTEYADTRIRIKRSNRCYFIDKEKVKGDGGFKRNEWKVIGDDTVELHMGLYAYKGGELDIPDENRSNYEVHKDAWNVFDRPLNCSDVPSREEWTVYQKVNGRWQITARQTFVINP